jgi:hypothetical protein
VAHVLVAQDAAHARLRALHLGFEHGLGIDLQQEVDAAAQVEAEVHRQRVQGLHPGGGILHQVDGDDVIGVGLVAVELALERELGLELGIGRVEAGAHGRRVARAFQGDLVCRNTFAFEYVRDPGRGVARDLDRGLAGRDLQGWRFAEVIRRRVQRAQQERDSDQYVFPDGIAIHSVPALGVERRRPSG